MSSNLDLGLVTAYGYAVDAGFTGTEAEFAQMLANIVVYKNAAQTAANDAAVSAGLAEQYKDEAFDTTPAGYEDFVSNTNSSLDYCIDNGVRNVFDIDGVRYIETGVNISSNYANGSVTLTRNSQSATAQTAYKIREFNSDWIGKKFTISVDSVVLSNQRMSDWRIFLMAYDNDAYSGDGTIIGILSASNGNVATNAIPTGTVGLAVLFRMSQAGSALENDTITWNKVQVEFGDEKTDYIPYAKSSALLTNQAKQKTLYNGFYTTQQDNQWEDTGITFTLTKPSLVLVRINYSNTGVRGVAVGTSAVFDYTSYAIVENEYNTNKQIVCYLLPATYKVMGKFLYAGRNNAVAVMVLQEFD